MLQIGGAANAAVIAQMALQQQQQGYWGGCGCPQPVPINTGHGNLPDATVGSQPGCWFFPRETRGYGLDLNNNGRYDAGQDGVLAFDLNRDGRITNEEIEASRDRLKAFGGNYDFNNDGQVSFCERIKGQGLRQQMQGMDQDGDGRLSGWELQQGGGRVLVDRNRDGQFQPWESYSPNNFPTPGFGRGRINFVDPSWNYTSVNHGWGWARPPYRY